VARRSWLGGTPGDTRYTAVGQAAAAQAAAAQAAACQHELSRVDQWVCGDSQTHQVVVVSQQFGHL
jgi:hypothetical protein